MSKADFGVQKITPRSRFLEEPYTFEALSVVQHWNGSIVELKQTVVGKQQQLQLQHQEYYQ